MALNSTTFLILLLHYLFVCSCLCRFSSSTATDIDCLRSIKESLEDPSNRLASSWTFNNYTEGFICHFDGVECWHPDENKVLNIRLSHLGLKGSFPRGIKNCTSLTGLNLSNNELSGIIPSDIAHLLPYVTSLDLSSNNFSGEIPKSLANLSYLNDLILDHNQLKGNIPKELGELDRINTFSVADNLLSGPVPVFINANFTSESYANNPHLCGGPLDPCSKDRNPFIFGFGIGYAVSVVAVIEYYCCCSKFMCWSCVQIKEMVMRMLMLLLSMMATKNKRNEADDHRSHLPTMEHNKEVPGLEKLVAKISLTELIKATDNFSVDNVVGKGKIGTMYRAPFPNNQLLAVKRIHESHQFESQFISELLALSRLKHDNLIPLLGYCIEKNEKFLVYKYMSNGNLDDWLHPVHGDNKILEWPLRVRIAIGIARGLAWLHHKCNFLVIHRNIDTNSILLDHYFEPKISNFGKSIISNHGAALLVYPEDSSNDSGLYENGGVWESDFVKKDVYDYGRVALELITGKKTISGSSTSMHRTLVEWFDDAPNSSTSCIMDEIIDKRLIEQGFDGEILELLRITTDCVRPFPYQRPTMLQVYQRISSFGERYGIQSDSTLIL